MPSPREIRLAFDSDYRTNLTVAAAQLACARAILETDSELVLETWDPRFKGIDDALVAGQKIRLLRGEQALKRVRAIAERLGCTNGCIQILRTRRGRYRIHAEMEV
jgi:hypothetical protein